MEKCFDPKVPQKCLGPLWDHPRPILDHFRPILETNRLTNYIMKNPITNLIKIPYKILAYLGPYAGIILSYITGCGDLFSEFNSFFEWIVSE